MGPSTLSWSQTIVPKGDALWMSQLQAARILPWGTELNGVHQDLGGPIQTVSHGGIARKSVGVGWVLLLLPRIMWAELTGKTGIDSHYVATQPSICPSDSQTKASLKDALNIPALCSTVIPLHNWTYQGGRASQWLNRWGWAHQLWTWDGKEWSPFQSYTVQSLSETLPRASPK